MSPGYTVLFVYLFDTRMIAFSKVHLRPQGDIPSPVPFICIAHWVQYSLCGLPTTRMLLTHEYCTQNAARHEARHCQLHAEEVACFRERPAQQAQQHYARTFRPKSRHTLVILQLHSNIPLFSSAKDAHTADAGANRDGDRGNSLRD